MDGLFRLGAGGLYEEKHKHVHPRTYAIEATTGPDRLRLGVDGVRTLRVLTTEMAEPSWILYILSVTRGENEPGRYGSAAPLDRSEMEAFFQRFGAFLGSDARHELWIKSATTADLLVYDPHEIVFAYGDLGRFQAVLDVEGYTSGKVVVPVPHMHYYHPENDSEAYDLLTSRHWHFGALTENDEARAEE